MIRAALQLTPAQYDHFERYARGLRIGGCRLKGEVADTVDKLICEIVDQTKPQAEAHRQAARESLRVVQLPLGV